MAVPHSGRKTLYKLAVSRQLGLASLLVTLCFASGGFARAEPQVQEPNPHQQLPQISASMPIVGAPASTPFSFMVVTYLDGRLTIHAQNAKLADILQAVASKTGIIIEIPIGIEERVISTFGAGPAANVLASLLYGSEFNYVMLGTDDDPNVLAQVVLSRKTKQAAAADPPTRKPAQSAPKAAVPAIVARAEKSEDRTTSAPRSGAAEGDQVHLEALASPPPPQAKESAPSVGQPNGATPGTPPRHHRRR